MIATQKWNLAKRTNEEYRWKYKKEKRAISIYVNLPLILNVLLNYNCSVKCSHIENANVSICLKQLNIYHNMAVYLLSYLIQLNKQHDELASLQPTQTNFDSIRLEIKTKSQSFLTNSQLFTMVLNQYFVADGWCVGCCCVKYDLQHIKRVQKIYI